MGPVPPFHHRIIMDLSASKVFSRAIDSVRVPLEHFIKTGFYDPHSLAGYEPEDIADFQTRRVCRQIAKEMKRPFIRCYGVISNYHFNGSKWEKYDDPKWESGYLEVPKRKYLMPLITPLLLAAPDPHRWASRNKENPVWQMPCQSLWQFKIYDRELWEKYYDFVLNDPDCRKARRLTS